MLPALIIAATISMKMVIILFVILLFLQFLGGETFITIYCRKSLRMHPLIIMGALLAGGEIAGIVGLIFAVPVCRSQSQSSMQEITLWIEKKAVEAVKER